MQVRFSNKKEGLVLAIRNGKEDRWVFHESNKLPRLPEDQAEDGEADISEADDED